MPLVHQKDVRKRQCEAGRHEDTVLDRVHDRALLDHLREVYGQWEQAGYPVDPGADRVVPYLFPTRGLLGGLEMREPVAAHARAGRYCYDTMTLVGPGTWEAARGAVDAARTASCPSKGGAGSE